MNKTVEAFDSDGTWIWGAQQVYEDPDNAPFWLSTGREFGLVRFITLKEVIAFWLNQKGEETEKIGFLDTYNKYRTVYPQLLKLDDFHTRVVKELTSGQDR